MRTRSLLSEIEDERRSRRPYESVPDLPPAQRRRPVGGFIVAVVVLGGLLTMAAVWAVSAGIGAWLLVKRRLAFWVPLVAGIVAMVALLIFAGAVLATDPVLLGFYSGVAPSTPVTPAP